MERGATRCYKVTPAAEPTRLPFLHYAEALTPSIRRNVMFEEFSLKFKKIQEIIEFKKFKIVSENS